MGPSKSYFGAVFGQFCYRFQLEPLRNSRVWPKLWHFLSYRGGVRKALLIETPGSPWEAKVAFFLKKANKRCMFSEQRHRSHYGFETPEAAASRCVTAGRKAQRGNLPAMRGQDQGPWDCTISSCQLVFSRSPWLGSSPLVFLRIWPGRQLVFSWRLFLLACGPPPPSYQPACVRV